MELPQDNQQGACLQVDKLIVELKAVVDLCDEGAFEIAQHTAAGLLREYPNHPAVIATMAHVCNALDEHGIGYSLMRRVVEMVPNNSIHRNSLGVHALGCMDYAEAERELRTAIKLDPSNWRAMSNLALTYVNRGEAGLAIEWGRKALSYEPNDVNVLETLGYALLMMGKWEDGFAHFEKSVGSKVRYVKPYGIPYWHGQPCKTLLVQGEQGIGDEVSFASVIPDIKGVERVVLECDKRLEGLFKRSFPGVEVYGTRNDKQRPDWLEEEKPDYQCLIGSLCTYFRKRDEDFSGTPYLVADPERRIQWRALLDSLGDKPKIGIAWKGGRPNTRRKFRSLTLDQLLPVLRADAVWVSLEYKSPGLEIETLEETHGIKIHHWERAAQAVDYDETAALVAELDLIVSVQTAIVHLAGAMGKTVLALIPSKPLWRYTPYPESTPWYKSVKLFKQKSEWAAPINKVAEEISNRFR